jgi:hypothetical protein
MDVVRASWIRKFPRGWWAGVPWKHNIEIDYTSPTNLSLASFPICHQLTFPVPTYVVTGNEKPRCVGEQSGVGAN